MKKINALVITGYGLNCEEETAFAFETAGAKAEIMHINDLIDRPRKLMQYQLLAIPGGFCYGDDTGAGNAFANKMRNHLWPDLITFTKADKLMIGICNGCQVLVSLGLVPAINNNYGKKEVALLHNDSTRYTVRWVDVVKQNESPWLDGVSSLSLPIAHGEGRLYAPKTTLQKLKSKKLIALTYEKGEMYDFQHLRTNPTGTLENIAALTDESGRIFGIMPHPERALSFTHLPNWTYLKEKYRRENKLIPKDGPGLIMFKNAVRYFQ